MTILSDRGTGQDNLITFEFEPRTSLTLTSGARLLRNMTVLVNVARLLVAVPSIAQDYHSSTRGRAHLLQLVEKVAAYDRDSRRGVAGTDLNKDLGFQLLRAERNAAAARLPEEVGYLLRRDAEGLWEQVRRQSTRLRQIRYGSPLHVVVEVTEPPVGKPAGDVVSAVHSLTEQAARLRDPAAQKISAALWDRLNKEMLDAVMRTDVGAAFTLGVLPPVLDTLATMLRADLDAAASALAEIVGGASA